MLYGPRDVSVRSREPREEYGLKLLEVRVGMQSYEEFSVERGFGWLGCGAMRSINV